MTETAAKQFSRCRIGDIVFYLNQHLFVAGLNSNTMTITLQNTTNNRIDVSLNAGNRLTYPITLPIPTDIIQARNTFMYIGGGLFEA